MSRIQNAITPVTMGKIVTACLVIGLFAVATVARSQTCPAGAVEWVAGVSGNWNVAENWEDSLGVNRVPDATDNVCIEAGLAVVVTVSDTQAANTLVSTSSLSISGSLSLNAVSEITGNLDLSGNLAAGPGLILAGTTTWAFGRIDGDVSNTGTLILNTTGTKTLGGDLVNGSTGLIDHRDGTLNLDAATGASVVNQGLHEFTADLDDVTKLETGADPVYDNQGTLRKSGGTGIFGSRLQNVDFSNTGNIEVLSGTLDIDDVVASTGTTFVMANNSILQLDGDPTLIADISGTFASSGAGTVDWTGDWVTTGATTFDFAPGVFTLGGNLDATVGGLANFGEITWLFGRVDGDVANVGTLVLSSVSTKTLGGSLTNQAAGVISHQDGTLNLDAATGASVVNQGLHEFTADLDDVTKLETGADPVYDNQGTLRKSGGTGVFGSRLQNVDFSNLGTVEVLTGTLTINAPGLPQISSNVLTAGSWRIAADSILNLFSGASIVEIGSGANVELLGPNATFTPLSDVATSTGTWLITGGATFSTVGPLLTTGDLTVGPNSSLTVNGDFTENSTNSLHIQIADESSTGQFGVVDVTGFQANLLGILDLDLVDGFTPVSGDFYDIIFWSTRSGTFSEIRDLEPHFQALYLEDRLRLNEPTNEPPVLDPIGPQSGDEETEITFTATATDPNDHGLTFTLEGAAPTGAGIDPDTGVFTWTPTEADGPDDFEVTVRVTDDGTPAMFDEEVVTITVLEVNLAPTLDSLVDHTVDEGEFVTFTATASDPDVPANSLIFSLTAPPPGASIGSTSGIFSWTPEDSDDSGPITVVVEDNGVPSLSDSGIVTVTVNNVAPVVEAGLDQTVVLGVPVSLDPATFTDAGSGDTHTAEIDWGDGTVEAGTVDQGARTVSGSHTYTSDGIFTVTVTVADDDGGSADDSLTVTVLANAPPIANAGGPYTVDEGSTVPLDGTGSTDPDGVITSYLWSPDSNLDDPAVAQPVFSAVDDDVVTMTLTVTDDGSPALSDEDTTTVTVNNVAPLVEAGTNRTVDEGDIVSLDPATFTDPGVLDTHTATINWGDGTVEAGTVDQDARTVSGSHSYGDEGDYTVTVTVIDDDGGSGSDTFTVTVDNVAPTLNAGADQTVDEGDVVVLDPATFTDPGTDDIHTATIDWGDGSPIDSGTVDDAADTIDASHQYVDDGSFTVTVSIDDGDGGTDSDTLVVTVNNVDPLVEAGTNQTVVVGDTVSLDPATFTDAGPADTHTAEIDWGDGTVEAGNVDQDGGTVTGSHAYTSTGSFTVTVRVTDDDGGVGSDTLTVTVDAEPNVPPTADANGPYSVDEGSTVSLDGTGSSDSDGTIASYSWSPADNLDDPSLAQPTFTGVDDDVVTMTLEVTDDDGATSDPGSTTTVTVNNVNPTVDAGEDQITTVGSTVFLDPATFNDPGTLDTHTAEVDWGDGTVEAGTVDQVANTVSGSHEYASDGIFTVTVIVTDDDDGVGSDTLAVTVNIASLPPDAVDDSFSVPEGTGDRILDVLANDTDPEGDPITIVSNTEPAAGTGTVTCDLSECTYNPPLGFAGVATFDYTISDGSGEDTATVTINVQSCIDPTGAFTESGLVTGYEWVECAHPAAHDLAGSDLTPLFEPTGTLLHMATGFAVDGVPGDTANDDLDTQFRGAFDVSVVRIDLDIPEPGLGEDPISCLAFDVLFASEEYPDFINKPYNDGFLAELNANSWSVVGSTIEAPDNFANDDGEYISVKGSFFDPTRVITDTGMVYNGATAVLRAFTPITPGAHELYLSIFDGADAFENSGALIDNLVGFAPTTCPGGVSQPPVAVDDSFTIDEDTSTGFDVLVNDFDPDGDDITILTVSDPAHGQVFVNAERTALTYIPDLHYHGPDTFEYSITDIPNSSEDEPIADESRATVTIEVIEVNDPPIAWPDGFDVDLDTTTVLNVLANDFDFDAPDGDIIWIDSFTDPVFGSVTCSSTDCTFTPMAGYDGPDSFTYTIIDVRETDPGVFEPRGGSDSTTVYINSDPPPPTNIPPTADANGPYESEACPEEPCTPLLLDGTGSFDPDGTIVEWYWFAETDGDVEIVDADTPTAGFITRQNGVFRIHLVVVDNDGAWDWDTTLITAFAAELTTPIDEGSSATATVDFYNPGGDLTTTIDWGDGSALEVVDFSIFPVTKTHEYPQDGVFDVEVCVTGETSEEPIDVCDIQQLTVENVLPVVDAGIDRSLVVGGTLIQSRMSFVDPGDDAPWTATVDWGDGSPVESLDVDQDTGILTMTTGHEYPTLGVFTVTVCVQDDDGEGCDTFDVTVSNNVPPVADAGGPYSGDEGAEITLDGSASSDDDGTVETYIWSSTDPSVTLLGADTSTPTFIASDNGTYEVTLQVCDDEGACSDLDSTTVEVGNVAPTVEAGLDQFPASGATVSLDPATFFDPGTVDTHTAEIDWGDGTVEAGSVDQASSTVAGSHDYAADGFYTVTVTVTDDDGESGSDSFFVEFGGEACSSLFHALSTGDPATDDGALNVGVDAIGAFGSAVTGSGADWNPPGPLDAAETVFSSNLYVAQVGDLLTDCAFGSYVVVSQSDTEVVTDSTLGDLQIRLTQTVTGTVDGSQLTQTYEITNTSGVSIDTALVRHVDGDLLFDGTLIDGGAVRSGGSVLFEFDSSDDPNSPSTFVGISGSMDGDSTPDSWTIQSFDYRPTLIDNGGIPATDDGQVAGDDDDDGIIDTPYDVTLSQQWNASIAAGATVELVTVTTFGQQTPNQPPSAVAGGPYEVAEGSSVLLDGTGSSDSDGTVESYLWSPDTNLDDATLAQPTFTGVDDDVVTVTLEVTDDGGATGSDTATVTVTNVAPLVEAGVDQTVVEGDTVSLDPATFTDPGSVDTHTATIDWGDGTSVEDGVVDQVLGTVSGSHVYADDGVYTVTVTVTDDDGGIGSDTFVVTVTNVAPSVDAGVDQTVNEGDTVSLDPATFTDPGTLDTHAATIDWGDGSPLDTGTVDQGAGTVDGSHVYPDEGTYTVTVTVSDDDGGAGSDTFQVVVETVNAAPVTVDDETVTPQDTPVSIDVLANDTDAEGDPLTVTNLTDPANGSTVLEADNTVTYTPDAGFVGTDTFTYTANDGHTDSDPATVTVFVIPPNKLLASDGAADDLFGFSVGVSGDRLVVGARLDDDNGTDSGSAYLYEPDGAGGWTETKLTASDAAPNDNYGHSVAVSGDRIVVGAYADDDNGTDSGAAYVYEPDGAGGWTETKLTASDGAGSDLFGFRVGVSGDRIVVGAHLDDDNGTDSGSAYVYEPDGAGGWTETKLTAADGAPNDHFGGSVAVSGDRIVVAASGDDDNGSNSGSAYVYEPDGAGGWTETKLTASDGAADDFFGESVAVSGDRIVVGARLDDDNGTGSGSAYVYEPDGAGGWTETKLTASDGATFDQFGWSVAISGDRIVVAANSDDDNGTHSGSVYVYEPDGAGGWTETKLTASDGAANDNFGQSVAVSGDRIVVGASHDDDKGSSSGSAYVYDLGPLPNDPPTADPDGPYSVDEGASVQLDGTGSSDPDGTIASYDWSPAGNLDDPNMAQPVFTGVDDEVVTITLTVTDDDGASHSADTTVTVINVAPTVDAGVDQSVLVNDTVVLDPATFTDSGSADTHTAEIDWGDGSAVDTGTVDQGAGTVDGSHVYPDEGTFTVTVTVSDDDGGAGSDTFQVVVEAVNTAPVSVDDETVTRQDTPVSIDVLANDTDSDGDTLTVTNLSDPPNGSAALEADGTVTYTPDAGFVGTDTFTYTANDGNADSDPATVTVYVIPPNKLLASDGAASDQFGRSVAVDGDRIVVGAYRDDDNGESSGAAYIYESDGAGGWTETKLTASDGAADDFFGHSVAVSGDRIVVGAYLDDDHGTDSGSVYVYEPDGAGGWTETKLTAADGASSDVFGFSVAVDGDRIVVGANRDDDSGTDSGAAYVYEPNGAGGWTETKLTASDGAALDNFGASVAVSGERIVVAAPLDDDNGTNSGSAYVYEPDGAGGWTETKLTASDGAANDFFGISVAISGDLAVVGAHADDDNGSASGSAYVYDLGPLHNVPPTADPDGPYSVDEGASVQLDGTGSSDPDGTIASYDWSPAGNLDDPTLAQPIFTGVDDEVVTMTLTVTDDDGATASAETTVTVNNVAPTVDAGADQGVRDGDTVSLDPATFTDPGVLDTHNAEIDWDDGTVEAGTVDQAAATVAGSHVYAGPGVYTVTVTVTDDDGGIGSDTFTVTVLDITPPVITTPGDLVVEATEPDGAIVEFVVTAVDDFDPEPVVECIPESGSLFPIGDTLVTCTATDAAGNSATADFLITVEVGEATFDGFIEDIEEFELHRGTERSLLAKIEEAQTLFVEGDLEGAVDALTDLINFVNAQEGKRLTVEEAETIRSWAQTIIDSITT